MTPPNCSNCADPSCQQNCTASFVLRGLATNLAPIKEDIQLLQEQTAEQGESLVQLSTNLETQGAQLTTQQGQLGTLQGQLATQQAAIEALQTEVVTSTQEGKEQVLKANRNLSILNKRCSTLETRSNNLERAQILKEVFFLKTLHQTNSLIHTCQDPQNPRKRTSWQDPVRGCCQGCQEAHP